MNNHIVAVNWCKILDDLYESEINFSIETLWDSGVTATIYQQSMELTSVADAAEWIARQACEMFPASEFAQKYDHGFINDKDQK